MFIFDCCWCSLYDMMCDIYNFIFSQWHSELEELVVSQWHCSIKSLSQRTWETKVKQFLWMSTLLTICYHNSPCQSPSVCCSSLTRERWGGGYFDPTRIYFSAVWIFLGIITRQFPYLSLHSSPYLRCHWHFLRTAGIRDNGRNV